MKKHLLSAVLLSLLSAPLALSAPVGGLDEPCPGDTFEKSAPLFLDDPYYPGARMRSGKYKGQCIDTSWQRPARILSRAEAEAAHVPSGYVGIANFSHGGRYWIAKIPVGAVEQVIFQMEHFDFAAPVPVPGVGIPSAHTEVRFKFRAGSDVILIPQSAEAAAQGQAPEIRVSDIIYSVELVAPKGVSNFDFVEGIKGTFGIVYRFCSLDDKAKYMIADQSHRVEQFVMNLNDAQKQKLLLHSIVTSNDKGVSGIYNTAFRNCTTEAFRLFDEALSDDPGYVVPKYLAAILDNAPSRSKHSLEIRNLLTPSMPWPDLNQEWKGTLPNAFAAPAPVAPAVATPVAAPTPAPSPKPAA